MLFSLNQYAEMTGIDRRVVSRRLAVLPAEPGPNRSKQYDSRQALPLLFGNDGRLDASQERARLDKARADLAEQELARRHRELIPVDEVSAAWANQVTISKGRLLSLPARVSSEVLSLKSQREIEIAIRDQVIAILEELSGDPVV